MLALTDISQDVSCPASARVSAARTVLELALKGVELEDLAVLSGATGSGQGSMVGLS